MKLMHLKADQGGHHGHTERMKNEQICPVNVSRTFFSHGGLGIAATRAVSFCYHCEKYTV